MPNEIQIIAPGTKVKLWGGVDGIVTAALVKESGVAYWVSYWSGSELKEQLVEGMLIYSVDKPLSTIGFKE